MIKSCNVAESPRMQLFGSPQQHSTTCASLRAQPPAPPPLGAVYHQLRTVGCANMDGDTTILCFVSFTYAVLSPWLWVSGRATDPSQLLVLWNLLAATLAMLSWRLSVPHTYNRLRAWSVAACQLTSTVALTAVHLAVQFNSPAREGALGAIIDVVRLITGQSASLHALAGAWGCEQRAGGGG